MPEPDDLWSIGELAARAGVTVKTVRFYSDRGLLPEAGRSAGGHRRYGRASLDRLRLIRALRGLDLPVPEVARLVDGDGDGGGTALGDDAVVRDVVAARLADLGSRMAALRWRGAALRLLQDCTAEERAERLALIGRVSTPPDTAALASFWRRWLPPGLPPRVVGLVLDQAVPALPSDPSPEWFLTFARLHAFTSALRPAKRESQPTAHRRESGQRPAVLYEGLTEAFVLVSPAVRAGEGPRPGDALDRFVAAYAETANTRDSTSFRRALSRQLAAEPRLDHYWELVARLSPPGTVTPGAAHDWLARALTAQTAPGAPTP
ncbi:MerR family transcriptional regulator [Streptomyces durbertensis]|uniref:MerR family transcriptional regulator n=1 Tax=Streptomyces durbertensis TaxID=2448886 RepID=A0ABR6EJT5_9ACTN|nr:MerR family transcriptional regulator [Streptomyces durbertensis]MBB1245599.1 MerR family transcriptional regulator [Streptomyces durbertensis]